MKYTIIFPIICYIVSKTFLHLEFQNTFCLFILNFCFKLVLIYCGRYLILNSSIVLCCGIVPKRGTHPSKKYLKMQNQKPNIEERQTVMKKGQIKQITIYKTKLSQKTKYRAHENHQ